VAVRGVFEVPVVPQPVTEKQAKAMKSSSFLEKTNRMPTPASAPVAPKNGWGPGWVGGIHQAGMGNQGFPRGGRSRPGFCGVAPGGAN